MNRRLDGYDWIETGAGKIDITGFISIIQRIIQEGTRAATSEESTEAARELGHRLFTPKTGVQFSYGVLFE